MTTYVSAHPKPYGTELRLHARCLNNSVSGVINIDIVDVSGNEHCLSIFTYNHVMASEIAQAINQITAKYEHKLIAA